MDLAEVARAERCLSEDLTTQVSSMESACQEVGRCVSLLHEDLAQERKERCAGLADMSCRIEDAFVATERTQRELGAARKRFQVDEMQTHMTTAALGGKGNLNGPGSSDTTRAVNAEHAALAACLGEMDAELRMEMGKRLNQALADVRSEMVAGVKALEAELHNFASQSVAKLDNRIGCLETARLDLRLGALETAWQHAAPFMVPRTQSVPNSHAAPFMVPKIQSVPNSPCALAVATGSTARVETPRANVTPRGEQYVQHNHSVDLSEHGCSITRSRTSPSTETMRPWQTQLNEQPNSGPAPAWQPCKYQREQFGTSSETPPLRPEERLSSPEEEGRACQPLISEDLKGRLESLVLQVKSTLSRAHSGQGLEASCSEGQPPQVPQGCASSGGSVASKVGSHSPNRSSNARNHCCQGADISSSPAPAPAAMPKSPGRSQTQTQLLVPHQVLRSVSISAPRRALRSQSPLRHSIGVGSVLTATPKTARSLATSSSAYSVVAPQQLWAESCAASPRPVSSQTLSNSWYGR